MKTLNQSSLNHGHSLNRLGRLAGAANEWPQRVRPWHRLARAVCGGVILAGLACGTACYGDQLIQYRLPGQSLKVSHDGVPVSDAISWADGNGSYAGSVSGGISQSEVGVSHTGLSMTYGLENVFESKLDVWVYNQPGQTGTVYVTVTPYFFIRNWSATATDPGGYQATCGATMTLTTSKNYVDWARQIYQIQLNGRADVGIQVLANQMAPYQLHAADGDQVAFYLQHDDGVDANGGWYSESVASVAWYTVSVSSNGYLSTGPRLPANPPVPVLPPITPQTTSATFTDGSHTQMTVSGVGGPTIAPLPYLVMTTTNLALPLANWVACQTNNFAPDGTFSYSFPVNANEPQRFFQVRMAQ